jgi:hypothetical protein
MLDLNLLVGKKVFLQVKSMTYIIGKQGGQLMPAMVQDDKGNALPLSVDYLLGTLDKIESESSTGFVLRYALPDGAKMVAFINPEFVQAVFLEDESRIEVTADMPAAPVAQ